MYYYNYYKLNIMTEAELNILRPGKNFKIP
jgi:hypothetical protein